MIDINEKSVSIDCDGRVIEMSMDRCKRYRSADELRGLMNGNLDLGEAAIQETAGTSHEEIHDDGYWDFTDPSPDMTPIFTVRTLLQSGPRANMEDFTRAKPMEIEGLRNRKVWKVVHGKDVPQDANIVGGRCF